MNLDFELSNKVSNIFQILLVWGLIAGTLLSYVPQYYKIYIKKNTIGISETMLIFGIFSSYFNVLGSIQENLQFLSTCETNNNCYNVYIPITQLFSPFLCALIFYSFFLYYNDDYSLVHFNKFSSGIRKNKIKLRAILSFMVGIIVLTYFIIFNCFNTYNIINNSGKVLNIISTIFSLIMWLPQIYTTYKLKKNHTLSLIALGIHAIGCLTTVIYQTVFITQPIWVIMCYIVGFISETSIILICLYYKRLERKRNINDLQATFL